jgi:hypothetical protein
LNSVEKFDMKTLDQLFNTIQNEDQQMYQTHVNLSKEFNELELVRKQLEDEIENDQKLMSKLEQEQNELVAM